MSRYLFAILKSENSEDHLPWIEACRYYSDLVDYRVVDFLASDWLEQSLSEKFDFYLTRAPGRVAFLKQLFDERIFILHQILGKKIYPTLNELYIYENKRLLSYFLKSNKIPHPQTWVIYDKLQAFDFARYAIYPIVAKTSIGAGGSGVIILKNKSEAIKYIEESFSSAGIKRSYMPNLRKGDFLSRSIKRMRNLADTIDHFKEKKIAATIDPQKWFVIFQEYIQSDFEWRCVVVNNSYFGHKKLRSFGEKMSGTSRVSWDVPDIILLNHIKSITESNKLTCQAIDLFYNEERGYLVNELQCFWGSKNPHQMIKNGIPGRYLFRNNKWIFEEGEFNTNNSYNLRLSHILSLLNEKSI